MGISATILPASEARKNFYTILEEVSQKFKRFTITRRGQAQAVVISPEEVAAWEETMEVIADKKLLRNLQQSEIERKYGQVVPAESLLKKLKISPDELV